MWEYFISTEDTAQTVLRRIIRQRQRDVKLGVRQPAYIVTEFRDKFHPEAPTGKIPNSSYAMSPVILDKVIERMNTGDYSQFNAVCNHLQRRIGVPFVIRPPVTNGYERRMRPKEEISLRVDKLARQLRKETKELANICGEIPPPVTSRISGAFDIMSWVYNGGRCRPWDAVFQKLYDLKVEQERDRLFHVRRHENDRNMNNCFNEEINGAIAELNWVLVDNPFSPASLPGLSKHPFPYQNETPVEFDE